MTEAQFLAEASSAGYQAPVEVQYEAGYRRDLHEHPFDALARITSGQISLVVDGQTACYAAESVFRLPAYTPHVEFAGSEGVRYWAARRPVAVGDGQPSAGAA